jgi:hypothetical protein
MLEKTSRIVAAVARIALGILLIVFVAGALESMAEHDLLPEAVHGMFGGKR